ncbi:MAG: hypothetical protein ACO1PM_05145 [Acidovorax sp.]
MRLTCKLKKIAAATALVVASLGAASSAWADITASATTSGSASAYTLVARITPDAQYLGRGKLYFVMLHGSQIYVLSETRGFIPYTGGEPEAYRGITQATETITVQGWNTTAQAGAAIFVGFGTDVMDMINNGRFKQVATLPQAPAPTPTPTPTPTPPVVTNPYAAYSGNYLCISETGSSYTVSATITATQAVVDTSRILTIPDYTFNVPYSNIGTTGDRIYTNNAFPLRLVSVDTTAGARYPLALGYASNGSSTPRVFICSRR